MLSKSPLAWHGIPPATKLSMTERIVSRVKSVNVGGSHILCDEERTFTLTVSVSN